MYFRERVFTKRKIGFYERKNWLPVTLQCSNISVGIYKTIITITILLYNNNNNVLFYPSPSNRKIISARTIFYDVFIRSFRLHIGVFLLEQERYAEAAAQLVEAVALEPEDYDLTVTAATALRQAGVSFRAEDMYRKAAALRPQVYRRILFIPE